MQTNRRWQQPLRAMNPLAVALIFALATFASPLVVAQEKTPPPMHDKSDVTDMQALRAAVKADKHAYIASTLALTSAEAKRFWPIYEAYQRSLDASSRRRVVALEGLLFHDKAITNLAARNLVTELMAIDEADVKARHRVRNRLMRALPPIKAARYLQLEDKIQAVRDYDIASTVPLIH